MQSFVPVPKPLKNASYLPALPASVSVARPVGADPTGTLDVQIGEGPVVSVVPLGDPDVLIWSETLLQYLQRAYAGQTDENGQNPLSIAHDGTNVVLTSGARIRVTGWGVYGLFGDAVDVSPRPARVFDTDVEHVRSGDGSLSERLAAADAKIFNPSSFIKGARRHANGQTLVSKGASEGGQLTFMRSTLAGETTMDTITIGAADNHAAVFDFVNNSVLLNPTGKDAFERGRTVAAFVSELGEPIIQSMSNDRINVLGTDADVDAFLG